MIKKYSEFINESDKWVLSQFGITYQDLDEILVYITDEFSELEYHVENSLQSSLIENDSNCFIISFNHKSINFPYELPSLSYIEPKIFDLVKDVDSHLRGFGLYVYANDFGSSNANYELVISRIGHIPTDLQRYR